MGAGAAAHLLPASSEMTEDAEFEYIPNSPEAGKPKQSPVPPSMTKGQPMRQRRVESFQMESHRFRAGAKLFAPYPRWLPSVLRMRLWCVKQRTTVRQRAISIGSWIATWSQFQTGWSQGVSHGVQVSAGRRWCHQLSWHELHPRVWILKVYTGIFFLYTYIHTYMNSSWICMICMQWIIAPPTGPVPSSTTATNWPRMPSTNCWHRTLWMGSKVQLQTGPNPILQRMFLQKFCTYIFET